MPREVSGGEQIVLMDDGDERREAKRNALVPVAGQAKAFAVDDDPRLVAYYGADHVEGLIVRSVIGDDQVEGHSFLAQDAEQGFGQMSRRCRWEPQP